MRKLRGMLIVIITILCIVMFSGKVNAENEKHTATSTINGISVQWEYEINENNKIVGLICTNINDFSGKMEIPSEIDGKTVVEIGNRAFKGCNQMSELIIPNTIEKIGIEAFSGCTNLSNVNLGRVKEFGGNGIFSNCTSLESIFIPKTLTTGYIFFDGPFKGCTSLTNIIFEEGITKIAEGILMDAKTITKVTIPSSVTEIGSHAFCNSGLTEITLPDSVEKIGIEAFEDCTNLSNVDLGRVKEFAGNGIFLNCTSLESIFIPKTLTTGYIYVDGPFKGCTSLTNIIFEEGITKIAEGILKDAKTITKVTIPSSVTEIGSHAFCDSGLTEIIIPNKVTKIGISAFEGTDLIEVEIPMSVNTICINAFKNCSKLIKITILDTVERMGNYDTPTDKNDIFGNHHEDLTIYCYENSDAAEHAIKNNIKYVYLERIETDNTEQEEKDEAGEIEQDGNEDEGGKNDPEKPKDNTIAPDKLPQTGLGAGMIAAMLITFIIGIVLYKKVIKYKQI